MEGGGKEGWIYDKLLTFNNNYRPATERLNRLCRITLEADRFPHFLYICIFISHFIANSFLHRVLFEV